ncbi:karyopherin Kap95 [Mucor ambiguus]|uniref:Karyopherin Kap95 n=1 Tax=Mucor ambiguus TaxID=91626 RepID=A0A0C9LXR8_9FUNG|nr:karyopherin Kap95 [Mucor ambiguus]
MQSNYAVMICHIIANQQLQDSVRMSAGLALKNSLAKSHSCIGILADQQTKHVIKTNILPLLATKPRNVANIISQLVATMAKIDIPLGDADDIVTTLVDNITKRHHPSNVKQVALQTIGYMCESMQSGLLSTDQKNALLTAIIDGSRKEQLDVEVKLAAIKALYNSLEFIRGNFEISVERDFIIKVICDAATPNTSSTTELQVAAYECLNRVASLYYEKLEDYMTSILYNVSKRKSHSCRINISQMTLNGMSQASDPSIVLLSIEFWSTICDIEITRKKENMTPMFSFADKLMISIIPTLFKLMIKKHDKLEDDDEWDIPQAASNCLSLLASCCKELVVPPLIRLIDENLLTTNHVSWNQKEAAIIAFGSILNGPSKIKMKPPIEQILPTVLACTKDPNVHVRLAAIWTLTEIIKESSRVLDQPAALHDIMSAIKDGLGDPSQKVRHTACIAIIHCAERLKFSPNRLIDTGPLSKYTHSIILCLLDKSRTFDLQDDPYMQTVYEAIAAVVKHSTKCINEGLRSCGGAYYRQHNSTIRDSILGRNADAKYLFREWCDTVAVELDRCALGRCHYLLLSDKISVYSDRIMQLFFSILQLSQHECNTSMSVLVEDVFLLASAMIVSIGPQFECFVDELVPHVANLMLPLPNQDYRLCLLGIGIISDLCSTIPSAAKPHATLFMQLLLDNLGNDDLHRDLKPTSLSCFGDVAHALGPEFLPFVNTMMMIIQQAGNMQADQNDQDMVVYVDAIRVAMIEAFVGMLQGLGQDPYTQNVFLSHVNGFMLFVNSLVKDSARSDALNQAIFGLLGIYGNQVPISMLESVLHDLMIGNLKGGIYFSNRTKEIAQWAQKIIAPH